MNYAIKTLRYEIKDLRERLTDPALIETVKPVIEKRIKQLEEAIELLKSLVLA